MAQGSKKRTAGQSKSGARRTGRQQEIQEVPEFLRGEVMIIVSLAAAVLLFLSNFHLCGIVGDFLRNVQLGLFGIVGYAFPILLFMGISFYVSNAGNLKAVIKLSGVTGLVFTICGLAQMIFGFWPAEGEGILSFYRESSLSGSGGGLIGGFLTFLLHSVMGNIATYLVLIALFVICCVIITEKSIVNFIKRGSGRVYQHAREDVVRRREEWAEIQEERRRGRDDNVVRGVDFGSIKIQQGTEAERSPFFAGAQNTMSPPEEPVPKNSSYGQRPMAETTGEPEMAETAPKNRQPASAPEMDALSSAESGTASAARRRGQAGYTEAAPAPDRGGAPPIPETRAYPPVTEAPSSAGAGADRADIDKHGMSSADVFSGKIEVPLEYMEPVPFEEDKEEKIQEKIISISSSGKTAKNTSIIRKNEPLYAHREIKTLAELDMTLSDLERSLERESWMDRDISGDVFEEKLPDGGADEDEEFLDSDYQDDEFFTDEDGFAEDERYLRKSKVLDVQDSSSYPNTSVMEEDWGNLAISENEDGKVLDFLEEETAPDFPEEEEAALSFPEEKETMGVSVAGDGSMFIPEEPKRVVTASGKIIETETELLHKKLEQRREEAREENPPAAFAQAQKLPPAVKKDYVFPPTTLLQKGNRAQGSFSDQEYKETAIKLQQTLKNFGVGVTVTNISCGPSVTRYELHPEQGVKVSKIVSLTDDIKLSLAAAEIRIEAPIPGKSAVGIEVPNKETATVYLRDLLESEGFSESKSRLTFAVGKDIGGQPVMADIGKMPHLLIAGATGSGKSVCINTLIMSIIFKSDPEDVKLIMVDPKVVELSVYNGIPHLLIPVVTDPKKASSALNWAVAEMDDRYRKFAQYNVRNLQGYNDKIKLMEGIPEEERPKKMPQIVIIIDELADLMMVVPGEVEDAICRLAQLARAAGIHLVIATQRPSVNVITGLIKANVPSRIAFAVSSGVDSRTIIDMNGAEKLLGKGDMLFFPSGIPKPQRVQGAFVSDQEVSNVVEFLTEQGLTANYNADVENRVISGSSILPAGGDSSRDEYFAQAGKFIIEKEKASIGMLQRIFKIGFNRAARIMDQLADAGVVGEEEGTKPRKVLMSMEEFEQFLNRGA